MMARRRQPSARPGSISSVPHRVAMDLSRIHAAQQRRIWLAAIPQIEGADDSAHGFYPVLSADPHHTFRSMPPARLRAHPCPPEVCRRPHMGVGPALKR